MYPISLSEQHDDDIYTARIGQAVDELMTQERIFQERLYRKEIIAQLTTQMHMIPPKEFDAVDDHTLRRHIGKFMAVQLLSDSYDDIFSS